MLNRILAVILAVASLIFFGYWSVVFAVWTGWTLTPPGWGRAVESIPALLISLAAGLMAIASFRWILRWRARSWWLLWAFVLPVWQFVSVALSTNVITRP